MDYWPFIAIIENFATLHFECVYLNMRIPLIHNNLITSAQIPDYQNRYHLFICHSKRNIHSHFELIPRNDHCSRINQNKMAKKRDLYTTQDWHISPSQRIQRLLNAVYDLILKTSKTKSFFTNHLCRSEETTICHNFSTPTIRSTPMLFIKSANNDTPQCFVLCHQKLNSSSFFSFFLPHFSCYSH